LSGSPDALSGLTGAKKAAEKRVNVELHLNLLRFEKLPN
jgi:hypothetical protein